MAPELPHAAASYTRGTQGTKSASRGRGGQRPCLVIDKQLISFDNWSAQTDACERPIHPGEMYSYVIVKPTIQNKTARDPGAKAKQARSYGSTAANSVCK